MKNSSLRAFVKKLIKHPFFAGSAVMVVGSNLFNAGQWLYHLIVARLLGPSLYGELAAIISLIGLLVIVQQALGLSIVKFISAGKKRKETQNLIQWMNNWGIKIGLAMAVFTLVISSFLTKFLHITDSLVTVALAPALLLFIVVQVHRSVLQGLLRFGRFVNSLLLEVSIKIVLSVALIISGYAVFGAMASLLISALLAWFFTRFSLKEFLSRPKGKRPDIAPLLKYSIPVFAHGLALTSFYSTDVILVKHFFPAHDAGIYASLAVLGRAAFFAASPVVHVMFPLVSKRHAHGQPYHKIFYLSALLIGTIAVAVAAVYFLFPRLAVGLLYGAEFLEGAPFLWWFAAFMGLLVFAMLFTQFYLSIGKTKVVWLFVLAAILQIVLIWFIHPDILTVIQLSILSAALLVLSLLVYFAYHHGKTPISNRAGVQAGKNHTPRPRGYR